MKQFNFYGTYTLHIIIFWIPSTYSPQNNVRSNEITVIPNINIIKNI